MKIQEVILRALAKKITCGKQLDYRTHGSTDAAVALAVQGAWI